MVEVSHFVIRMPSSPTSPSSSGQNKRKFCEISNPEQQKISNSKEEEEKVYKEADFIGPTEDHEGFKCLEHIGRMNRPGDEPGYYDRNWRRCCLCKRHMVDCLSEGRGWNHGWDQGTIYRHPFCGKCAKKYDNQKHVTMEEFLPNVEPELRERGESDMVDVESDKDTELDYDDDDNDNLPALGFTANESSKTQSIINVPARTSSPPREDKGKDPHKSEKEACITRQTEKAYDSPTPIKQEEVVETKPVTPEIRAEWNKRVDFYSHRIRWNSGCGQRGQVDVDRILHSLEKFAKPYPELQKEMPGRAIISGGGGPMGELGNGLAEMAKNGDGCSIM